MGKVQLKAVLEVGGVAAGRVFRPHVDEADLARVVVVPLQRPVAPGGAADGADKDDSRVLRVDGDVAALPGADRVAVLPGDAAELGGARHADARVVLLRGADPVGELAVDADAVELRGRLVVDRRPGLAAVQGDAGAAVVPLGHPPRVSGVDPQVVVVPVRGRDLGEGRPAVGRLPHPEVEDVEGVGVLGVGEDVAVVERAVDEVAAARHPLPVPAAVVGPVQPGLFRLDDGPHPLRPGRGNGDADLPLDPLGKSRLVRQVLPGVAAVAGLVQAASGAAARHVPEVAVRLPDRRVDDARVVRVHRQVDGPGPVAGEQDPLPVPAAVARAVHPALVVGAEQVAEGGDVHEVGVVRVDADLADVAGVLQPGMSPAAAAVRAAVHAVAPGDVEAGRRLPHAGVDDVGVGLGNRQGPDRGGVEVPVGDVLPVGAGVLRLPDPAGAGAEVEDRGLGGMAGHGDHAPAPGRAYATVFQSLYRAFVHVGAAFPG